MNKSRKQVRSGVEILYVGAKYVWAFSVELASCHPCGAPKFEVAARFLENVWTSVPWRVVQTWDLVRTVIKPRIWWRVCNLMVSLDTTSFCAPKWRFGGPYFLHPQGSKTGQADYPEDWSTTLKTEALPWRLKHYPEDWSTTLKTEALRSFQK